MTKQSTLKQRTARGLLWGGLGSGAQQLIGFLFGMVLMRLLSPEEYGVVGLLAVFSAVSTALVEGGFTNALINRSAFKHDDYNCVFWFSSALGLLLYTILWFCAPLIASFFNEPALIPLSRIVFLGFLINSFSIAHTAKLYKEFKVKERAGAELIAVLIASLVAVTMALHGFSYWGIALQNVLFLGVSASLKIYFARWRPTFRLNLTPLKEMVGFASRLLITSIMWYINTNIFSVILGRYDKIGEVGNYTQGNKWMMIGSGTLTGMINSVAQPIFVQVVEDNDRLLSVFRKMLRFSAFVSFPLMLGFAYIAPEFITITVKEKWLGVVPFVRILCVWGAFNPIWNLYIYLLYVKQQSKRYMYGFLGICLFQTFAVWMCINCSIHTMVSVWVGSLLMGLLVWQKMAERLIPITLGMVIKDVIPYLLITLVSFLTANVITYFIDNIYITFAMKIIVSAIAYVMLLWKLDSVIFKEMIHFLRNKTQ